MPWDRRAARAFRDETGRVRHAHPWNGWTRMAMRALAGPRRASTGGRCRPGCLRLHPCRLPLPRSEDAWSSRSVPDGRLRLERGRVPVPTRHRCRPPWLVALSGLGGLSRVDGAVALEPWPTLPALALAYPGKLWFLDRMV